MCTSRNALRLLILPLCLAGCASTGVVSPNMKTVASVGDKSLPVVLGEPGSAVASDRAAPERRRRPDGRISGRVVDENGEPMPNVRVRLAVGNAAGGKVVRSTTDRTGAFTLKGLRPGSTYTVIAEDEEGTLVGRTEASAPETNIRISLGATDVETPKAAKAKTRKSVSRISDKERLEPEGEDEEVPAERPRRKVNEEDLPPAPEADALSRSNGRGTSSLSDEPSPRVARWRAGSPEGSARATSATKADTAAPPTDPETHGTSGKAESLDQPGQEDEGTNPLPPALERGPSDQSMLPPAAEAEPTPAPALAKLEKAEPGPGLPEVASEDLAPAKRPLLDPDEVAAAEPMSPGAEPGALAPPVEADQAGDVFAQAAPAAGSAPAEGDQLEFEPTPAAPADPPTPRRPTWKELSALAATTPIPREGHGDPPPQVASEAGRPRTERTALARAAPPGQSEKSSCDFDSMHRRIQDFSLPDLQGRPVHFRDLDADLVLIDFWGTWCQPCIRSIPHLVELQKKSGASKLKVVGVACENVPPQQRPALVATQAKKLGINYPVLLSGMDGPCPLQEALKIQAYPTLILVDRQGRIVWRDQGANRRTMASLDRFLASATRTDGVRRY